VKRPSFESEEEERAYDKGYEAGLRAIHWRRVAKGTAAAIKTISQKWYSDCYNTEAQIQRLMLWETRLRQLLGEEQ